MANQAQDRTKRLYGLQWNRYRIIRSEEDEATLKLKTGLAPSEFFGKTVLDGGCGMGRYARVAASSLPCRRLHARGSPLLYALNTRSPLLYALNTPSPLLYALNTPLRHP